MNAAGPPSKQGTNTVAVQSHWPRMLRRPPHMKIRDSGASGYLSVGQPTQHQTTHEIQGGSGDSVASRGDICTRQDRGDSDLRLVRPPHTDTRHHLSPRAVAVIGHKDPLGFACSGDIKIPSTGTTEAAHSITRILRGARAILTAEGGGRRQC